MRGEDDADRMRAAHQRHGDADEAVAGDEFEHAAGAGAHHYVDRDAAGERPGQQHGDDVMRAGEMPA